MNSTKQVPQRDSGSSGARKVLDALENVTKWIYRKTSLKKFEVRKNWRPWPLWLSSSWGLLTDALPKLWKDSILNCRGYLIDFCIFDFHLAKKDNLHCLNKLGSRELYQFKFLKSTENQLHRYAMKNFSTILVLSGIQYIYWQVW